MEIPDDLLKEISSVLINNVGDNRLCPLCTRSYIPKDRTAKDAWVVYNKLKRIMQPQAKEE